MNKKKSGLLNKIVNKKLNDKGMKNDLSLLKYIKLYLKVQFGGTFIFLFFKFILIGVMMVFLMLAAAGIVQFFEEDNKTLKDMDINWDDYQCTCVHLTPAEIAKVKAGGQVEVDNSNGSGINISGGSVVNAERGLSGYLWGNFPMEYFALSTNGERGSSDANIKVQVGDGGKAYTIMQLDYRYDLHNWITQVYNKDPVTWAGLAEFQSYSAKDDRYLNNQNLINVLNEVYTTQPLKYISDLPNFFYNEYCSLTNRLYALGIDFEKRHAAVQSAYISASINCGEENLVNRMESAGGLTSSNGSTMSDEELIDCIYIAWRDYRVSRANTDGSSSASASMIKDGHRVGNKGTGGEWDLAIMFLKGQWIPSTQNNPIGQSWAPGWDYANSIKLATKVTPTNNTTASFGQTGAGTTQSNSGNSGLSTNTNTDYDLNSFSVANNANLMVVVEGTGGSNCAVKAFEKSGSTWVERVNTIGVLGENGMNSNRIEGDKTTPVGVFRMNTPFGQADSLDGFPSDYIKVDEHDYWSGEDSTYNKYVRDTTRVVAGEAIGSSAYAEIYDYAIDSGYNISGTVKKGSALFIHCTKANKVSTAGCVAIPKDDMITIMKLFAQYENNSYIVQGVKGTINSLYDAYNTDGLSPSNYSSTSGSTSSGTNGVQQNTLKYSNGEKISLESTWEYASDSKINSGAATYYTATENRKNICISVNAGHGCAGGSSVKTKCHPDGTPKVTGGTTEAGNVESTSISEGMTFKDGTSESVVNLKVAQMLKSELLSMGYDVLMIRDSDDEQLDNIARTVISNNVADAHIAIHFDSSESDKGVFYMSVANGVKDMEPVKSHWQEHNALGESLVAGLVLNGATKFGSGSMEMDLTQTSYSTIPSVDIELGDKLTDYSDASCSIFAKGMAAGVEEFFKTHTPANQAKRGASNISNESGNTNSTTNSGVTNGGVVNKNLNNLRTKCMMKEESICGCYISDPSCMCHVLAGEDGVIGTDDDGQINTNNGNEQNISGLTAEQSQVINAAKEVMQIYLETLKVKYPSYYEAGWTSTTSPTFGLEDCGPWYGYSSGYHEPIINGISYNGARWDCSSYVNGVLIRLGAPWAKVGNSTSTMLGKNFMDSVIADDRFILLKYDINILQPGDIVLKNKHTEILYKMIDVNTSTVSRYGWGSTGAVRTAYDATTRTLLNEPTILSYSYYNNGARADEYIIRYVGSGGAGK